MNILTLYYICYVILAIDLLDSDQEPSYNLSKNLLLLPRILKLMKDMVDDSTPLYSFRTLNCLDFFVQLPELGNGVSGRPRHRPRAFPTVTTLLRSRVSKVRHECRLYNVVICLLNKSGESSEWDLWQ